MRIATLLVPLVVSPLLAGCLRDADPIDIPDDAPAVFAILEAGADTAAILVARAGHWLDQPGYEGIDGAEVRLIHDADTLWAIADPSRPCVGFGDPTGGGPAFTEGCYHLTLPAPIEPGEAYGLEIALPNGQRVVGATTVPQPPALTAPDPTLRVTASCQDPLYCYGQYNERTDEFVPVAWVPVEWELPAGHEVVQLQVTGVAAYLDGATYPSGCYLGYGFGGDDVDRTGRWAIPNIGCFDTLDPARFDSIRAAVTAATLDRAYAAFLDAVEQGQSVRAASVSQGLEGAYGVFGAIAPARRTFTILRDPAPGPPPNFR